MTLFGCRRAAKGKSSQGGTTFRPCLERLEDRVVPADIATTTNIAIGISPNLFSRTAVETITATVTQQGSTTPVTSGNVSFNVNNQQGSVPLNGNGQAAFTVTLPLFAVTNNQAVVALYQGATVGVNTFFESDFLSPVYLNMLNGLLPSQINFGTPPTPTVPLTPFNSASGETNAFNVFFLPVDFNYIDPGRIQTIDIGGFTLPGAFASAFGIQQIG